MQESQHNHEHSNGCCGEDDDDNGLDYLYSDNVTRITKELLDDEPEEEEEFSKKEEREKKECI